MCLGNFESAGTKLSGRMPEGSSVLHRQLSQASQWVSTQRDMYLSALFRRLAARRGKKRATIAVRHSIVVTANDLMKRKQDYFELGADYLDKKQGDALKPSLVRRLQRLGHPVTGEASCWCLYGRAKNGESWSNWQSHRALNIAYRLQTPTRGDTQ